MGNPNEGNEDDQHNGPCRLGHVGAPKPGATGLLGTCAETLVRCPSQGYSPGPRGARIEARIVRGHEGPRWRPRKLPAAGATRLDIELAEIVPAPSALPRARHARCCALELSVTLRRLKRPDVRSISPRVPGSPSPPGRCRPRGQPARGPGPARWLRRAPSSLPRGRAARPLAPDLEAGLPAPARQGTRDRAESWASPGPALDARRPAAGLVEAEIAARDAANAANRLRAAAFRFQESGSTGSSRRVLSAPGDV